MAFSVPLLYVVYPSLSIEYRSSETVDMKRILISFVWCRISMVKM